MSKDKPTYIEDHLKSEEVQAIIDRMPTQWAKYVALITTILICLIIILGFVIKYPDTVDGQILVTAKLAPVRIVAKTSGTLHLLKLNKTILSQGDIIAYIESGANYKDILALDSLLHVYQLGDKSQKLPFHLTLGDIGQAYNVFVLSHTQYVRLINSDIYVTMRRTLQKQIESDKDVVRNFELESQYKEEQIKSMKKELEKDRVLLEMKAITEDEYYEKQRNLIDKEESRVSLNSSRLSKISEINRNSYEIQRIKLEENEGLDKAFSELQSAMNTLSSSLYVWKETYLQYAAIDGELAYLGFWRENSFVKSGQELFSVIPTHNEIIGEVIILSQGAGKVETGQTANVKIDNYPYDEYGLLKGKVLSLSRVTNKIETNEGIGDVYQVLIDFPDGLKTNFGIELPMEIETKGTVEIITKHKRLIQRLFDNLKAKTEKGGKNL